VVVLVQRPLDREAIARPILTALLHLDADLVDMAAQLSGETVLEPGLVAFNGEWQFPASTSATPVI
jgi:hypothetical protein